MPEQENDQPKLSTSSGNYLGDKPFKDDKLEREALAAKFTGYLDRLKDGAVLAIDAPWGEGKTWFGKNWDMSLQEQDYKTIYIDAFEQDYIEDPFMLITAELLNTIDSKNPLVEGIKQKSIDVAKALLPMATKAALSFGGKVLLGSHDLSDDLKGVLKSSTETTSELATMWASEYLDNYTNNKLAMKEFKVKLSNYAQSEEKPLVIFIDELDRCKPTFAVNLVERIKHFFDVPNIVFVLLLNKEQLEKAIKGVYGIETDASQYLDKFVNFFFRLPKNEGSDHVSQQKLLKFINLTMSKYDFSKSKDNEVFIEWLQRWASYFQLSLRDIQKCVALYAFAYPTYSVTYILPYFIVLKVKEPKLFNELLNNKVDAHSQARKVIEELIQESKRRTDSSMERILSLYLEWHKAHETDFQDIGDAFKEFEIQDLWASEKKDYFSVLGKMIDIDIER